MPVLRDAAIFRWLYPMDSRFRGNDGESAGMTHAGCNPHSEQ